MQGNHTLSIISTEKSVHRLEKGHFLLPHESKVTVYPTNMPVVSHTPCSGLQHRSLACTVFGFVHLRNTRIVLRKTTEGHQRIQQAERSLSRARGGAQGPKGDKSFLFLTSCILTSAKRVVQPPQVRQKVPHNLITWQKIQSVFHLGPPMEIHTNSKHNDQPHSRVYQTSRMVN